jgi:hypothetical protein
MLAGLDLELQFAGPVLALVTFLTIWWGHVLVRVVHYYFGTRPAPLIFVLGLALLFAGTQTWHDLLSATLGIVGLTLVWDAFELHRQELRVRQGHAPLNPRVHKEAAGLLAAQLAETMGDVGDEGICLSCGSTPSTRFLCRHGPYCKMRQLRAGRSVVGAGADIHAAEAGKQ